MFKPSDSYFTLFKSFLVILIISAIATEASLLFSYLAHLPTLDWFAYPSLLWTLPLAGAVVFYYIEKHFRAVSRVGLVHLIGAYHFSAKHLDFPQLAYQVTCTLLLLWSGFALGVVGPCCFIAVILSQKLARWAGLPETKQRLSQAMGLACAIAALFQAPFTATILAAELVMRQIRWQPLSIIFVMSYSASYLSKLHGGSLMMFDPPILTSSFAHLALALLVGICCGLMSSILVMFLRLAPRLTRAQGLLIVAGFTAIAAYLNPEWLGINTITVEQLMTLELTNLEQAQWLFARMLLSGLAIAIVLPAGSIGPMLVIGGIIGYIIGHLGVADAQLMMVLVGMGALFGAVFKVPWAAVVLIVEQTQDINIVLPAIIACVSASHFSHYICGSSSLIQIQLQRAQINLSDSPVLRKK